MTMSSRASTQCTGRPPGKDRAAFGQVGRQQPGGPQLAVARNEVAAALPCLANEGDGAEHVADVGKVGREGLEYLVRTGLLLEQCRDGGPVTRGDGLDPASHVRRRLLGSGHQAQEGIRGLGHGRDHDGLARHRLIEEYVGHAAETVRVTQAGAAKLVDMPTVPVGRITGLGSHGCVIAGSGKNSGQ